jgi:hypothetical protein
MALFAMLAELFQKVDLISTIMDAGTINPKEIVREALEETKQLSIKMCANEGQLSVIERYGIPAFEEHAKKAMQNEYEWEDVDLQDYMDFVGEIIAEGNSIMSDACQQAAELQEEIEEAIQDAALDLIGPT